MSKNLCVDEVEIHKEFALSKLRKYLENEIERGELKRVNLLAYWFEEFVNYLKREKKFDSSKLKRYKRGEIVKINFGFNVGSELGGLHYAVVLNSKDTLSSPVLTVIPLSSIKENRKPHPFMLNLGTEIYDLLNGKIQKAIKDIKDTLYSNKALTTILEIGRKDPNQDLTELENMHKEIKKMKSGSYALLNQITTISKMRINNPIYSTDALSGIHLSNENMNLLDKCITKYYFKKQTE